MALGKTVQNVAFNITRFIGHRKTSNTSLTSSICSKYLKPYCTETDRCKDNIILMGSPGSGKTTVGRLVAQKLGMPAFDIDDHHLEPQWKMPVSDKLADVGSERFIEEEGKALMEFNAEGSVVSLTGSNPMHEQSMSHVSKSGVVVFLDVQNDDIVQRLERMKVNRIVGQGDGVPMADILKYRQQFYEKSYDVRIIVEENETQESISNKIVTAVKRFKNNKGYVSSRQDDTKTKEHMSFADVVLKGLAPDGGLYVPDNDIPQFSLGELNRLSNLNYQNRAVRVLEKWIHPSDLHPSRLKEFIFKAYSQNNFNCNRVFPVRHLVGNQYLCELFHGPTASFKDAALQLMPQFFVEALQSSRKEQDNNYRYLILVATSGDTGGAVLDGFTRHAGKSGVGVMVLYPEEGISEVQKKQMTSMDGENIHVVGIKGDFDLCQSFVKKAFTDKILSSNLETANCKLSAANSISWGRLVPQIVFHVNSYIELVSMDVIKMGHKVDLCVPTGNFGNILAAFYAKEMGIPFDRLICSSNSNNVLSDCLHTGIYDLRNRKLIQSFSPAMDILVSSNLERYIYNSSSSEIVRQCFGSLAEKGYFELPSEVFRKMQNDFVGDWCSEDDCRDEICQTLKKTGYLLDPHTAVGKAVANRFQNNDMPVIIASTAHYEKFAPEVLKILGEDTGSLSISDMFGRLRKMRSDPISHNELIEVLSRPKVHNEVLNNNYKEVVSEIENFAKSL